MADIKTTIRGLEQFIDDFKPFCGNRGDWQRVYDALALLREQNEGIVPIESTTEQKKFADRIGLAISDFWCGACHFNLIGRPKFCSNCGKKVKWDD
jgi:mono/diheme cytochrome c family protein